MREILFRGKRIDNGEWEYGQLKSIHKGGKHYETAYYILNIYGESRLARDAINPDTIGQFTGLYDKNGKKIFEGDIVEVNHGEQGKAKGIVVYTDNERGHCGFIVHLNNKRWTTILNDYAAPFPPKILGNIYDNPELMEGV